ncbi:hypothetical protein [Pseudoxanthomonas sp. J35]|uniref:hypothetical protein n=1 Tax=Pseudoxanthomonas sp. J35 TaxID=935852 RepID=UPI00048BB52E|nr:hypothetical protein [Pseudoxanthomonas sp. J35]
MNRRLFWSAVAAVVAVAASAPLWAQDRGRAGQSGEKAALAEHQAQEQREQAAAAERAKRREAARSGNDPRGKADAPRKEEEEEAKRPPR